MADPYIVMEPRGAYDCLARCSCGWSELCKSEGTAQDRADWHLSNAHPPQPAASEAALLCDFLDWLIDDEGNERDWFFKRYGLSIGERSNIRIAKRFLATRAAAGGQDASV